MRLFLLFIGVSLLGVAALTACNSNEFKSARTGPPGAQQSATVYPDGARRVTIAELKGMIERNEAFVVDVRNQASYDAGHIRGARLIPEAEIGTHLSELPSNKLIVTYCSWPNEHTSARAVVDLKSKGITNAAALLGGFNGWQTAGLPIDKNATPEPSPK